MNYADRRHVDEASEEVSSRKFVKSAASSLKDTSNRIAAKASDVVGEISSRLSNTRPSNDAEASDEAVIFEAEAVSDGSAENNSLNEIDAERVLAALYEKALNGIPKVSRSVEDMVEDYRSKSDSPEKAAISLSKAQVAKCGTSGFLSGLGGVITLPVTIPANIGSVLYVQMRMVAAIAKLGGYDIRSDQVQTLVYMCLTGTAVTDVAKQVGIKIGSKTLESAIKKIPGSALTAINRKIGFRLLTKFGEKGAINLGKMIPVAGGVIGGSVDTVTTTVIAKNAIKVFIEDEEPDGEFLTEEEGNLVGAVTQWGSAEEAKEAISFSGSNGSVEVLEAHAFSEEGDLSIEREIELVLRLKELLDAGVLTQEEFEAKKKLILGI